MNQFTEKQPKHGDRVLICAHVKGDNGEKPSPHCHFFWLKESLMFIRPDGTASDASWLVLCNECFTKYPQPTLKDLMANIIRGDAVWQGDDPIIKVDPTVN